MDTKFNPEEKLQSYLSLFPERKIYYILETVELGNYQKYNDEFKEYQEIRDKLLKEDRLDDLLKIPMPELTTFHGKVKKSVKLYQKLLVVLGEHELVETHNLNELSTDEEIILILASKKFKRHGDYQNLVDILYPLNECKLPNATLVLLSKKYKEDSITGMEFGLFLTDYIFERQIFRDIILL